MSDIGQPASAFLKGNTPSVVQAFCLEAFPGPLAQGGEPKQSTGLILSGGDEDQDPGKQPPHLSALTLFFPQSSNHPLTLYV